MTAAGEPGLPAPAVPYRGIRPFRYADHAIFFAREEESRLLFSLVTVYRGVFLYGDSGNGKSSLVNAGLLPRARSLGYEPVIVRVQPRAGEELVVERVASTDDGAGYLPCLLAPDAEGPARIVLSIAEFEERLRRSTAEHRPLIVFDQFEEIVTLFEDAAQSRIAIADMIVGLLHDPLPVKLLLAFREDYLGRVKQLLSARPELVDQAVRLGPPGSEALATIIRGPFQRFPGHFGREFEPALVARLGTALAERFGTGDVSLSEVQTVCLRLWQSPDPEAALAGKGVQGLLEDDLGEALDAFAPDVREAAVALLSQMVTASGTRNVVSAEDLRHRVREEDDDLPPALVDEALDRLERDSKLVRRERRRDVDTYEITSEFLVPWISARRAELRSERERARDRRRLRVLGALAGAMLIVTAIVAVLATLALSQRNEAQRQRAQARLQAARATSLGLTSAATSLEPTRPDVSLLLALAGVREHLSVEARRSAIRATLAARDPAVVAILHGHAEPVGSVAFSAEGRTLASASADATIRLWDVRTHKQIGRPLRGNADEAVTQLAFSPGGRILASGTGRDPTVRLWDARTRRPIGRSLQGYQLAPGRAFSPDGQTLALPSSRGIALIDVATGKATATFGVPGVVRALSFSQDGRSIVVASGAAIIRWDVRSRPRVASSPSRHIAGDIDLFAAPALASNLRSVAYADGTRIREIDARTGRERGPRLTTRGRIYGLALSSDERVLAAATASGLELWDWRSHKPLAGVLTGHAGGVTDVATSPDGHTIATAGEDHTVRLWDLRARARDQPRSIVPGRDVARFAAFAPGADVLAIVGRRALRLQNTRSATQLGSAVRLLPSPFFGPYAAFSANGRLAIKTARQILVLDTATGRALGRIRTLPTDIMNVAALSRDGRTVAATSERDDAIRFFDTRTGKPRGRALRARNYIGGLAFSPDGKLIAASIADGSIRLWDLRTYEPAGQALAGHTYSPESVAFSPDGKILASANLDKTIRLWDLRTRRQLGAPLTGHTEAVRAVTFSGDGRTLASTGDDGSARLWNVQSRDLLATLRIPDSVIVSGGFSADGRTVLTLDLEGRLRRWRGLLWRTGAELQREVCDFVGDGLDVAEWQRFASGVKYRRTCP